MSQIPPDPFEPVLADLLARLARVMLARGQTLGAGTEAMKRALLMAAIEAEGDGVSDSRISVLTGLHRKDVKRLRADDPAPVGRKGINRLALLISHWKTHPDFVDHAGQPRVLTRDGDDQGPGFDDLVRQVRLDVAPGTMAQALMDQGAVEELADGALRLAADALLPPPGSADLIAAYQATLTSHLDAATHNVLADPDTPRHFDRVLRYSHLSSASIEALNDMARAEGQALLERLNAAARAFQDRDGDQSDHDTFAMGVYVLPGSAKGDRS